MHVLKNNQPDSSHVSVNVRKLPVISQQMSNEKTVSWYTNHHAYPLPWSINNSLQLQSHTAGQGFEISHICAFLNR